MRKKKMLEYISEMRGSIKRQAFTDLTFSRVKLTADQKIALKRELDEHFRMFSSTWLLHPLSVIEDELQR